MFLSSLLHPLSLSLSHLLFSASIVHLITLLHYPLHTVTRTTTSSSIKPVSIYFTFAFELCVFLERPLYSCFFTSAAYLTRASRALLPLSTIKPSRTFVNLFDSQQTPYLRDGCSQVQGYRRHPGILCRLRYGN
jgi:hypothetical protein